MPQATKIQSRLYTLFMVVITPHFAKGDDLGHLNLCRISKLFQFAEPNIYQFFQICLRLLHLMHLNTIT